MHTKEWVKASCASLMMAALMMQPVTTLAQNPKSDGVADQKKLVEIAPRSSDEVARYTLSVEDAPNLTHAQKLALLRRTSNTSSFSSRRTAPLTSTSAPTPGLGACSLSPPRRRRALSSRSS